MTSALKRYVLGECAQSIPVANGWTLDHQIGKSTDWIRKHFEHHRDEKGEWVLEIGFNARFHSADLVQDETLPPAFMELLVEHRITLRLSIFPDGNESD